MKYFNTTINVHILRKHFYKISFKKYKNKKQNVKNMTNLCLEA